MYSGTGGARGRPLDGPAGPGLLRSATSDGGGRASGRCRNGGRGVRARLFPRLQSRVSLLQAFWLLAASPCHAADPPPRWDGAAFEGGPAALRQVAAAGAKVVRVYRERDVWVLDEAQKLGLRVVMGLWLAHPRHGHRLDDAAARQAQEEVLRAFVIRYRQHPALLAWGVGNEVETGEADPLPVWREVNRLAAVVKALDPAHPTLMVVADGGVERLKPLADCCPAVDLVGINVYAGALFDLPQRLQAAGIAKPVVVTELGALGQWQAGRKPWGAPVELTSSEKAVFFTEALAFLRGQPQIVGSFASLWGAKQEQTETWHGLLLADGSPTAMSDALAAAWGRPVAEPAPVIRGIGIAADVFAPRQEISAGVDARGLPRLGAANRMEGAGRSDRPARGRRRRSGTRPHPGGHPVRRRRHGALRRTGATRRLSPLHHHPRPQRQGGNGQSAVSGALRSGSRRAQKPESVGQIRPPGRNLPHAKSCHAADVGIRRITLRQSALRPCYNFARPGSIANRRRPSVSPDGATPANA